MALFRIVCCFLAANLVTILASDHDFLRRTRPNRSRQLQPGTFEPSLNMNMGDPTSEPTFEPTIEPTQEGQCAAEGERAQSCENSQCAINREATAFLALPEKCCGGLICDPAALTALCCEPTCSVLCIPNPAITEDCRVDRKSDIGDGFCDPAYNYAACGFDDGDCKEENDAVKAKYPNCKAEFPSDIGDGACNGGLANTAECGWDGGDCIIPGLENCHLGDAPMMGLGDGFCDGAQYNTEECEWDMGDCNLFNARHRDCLGGGSCASFNATYPGCLVDEPALVGNGDCNGKAYNVEACGWDGGDCLIDGLPDCHLSTSEEMDWLGDSFCDPAEPFNTEDCGWDLGDCLIYNSLPDCQDIDNPAFLADGVCDIELNTTECNYDGGDCITGAETEAMGPGGPGG